MIAEPKARRRARASPRGGGLKEAQSKRAGRRTGTGYEVWYTRDESRHRRDDREVLHPPRGVLYKSGAYARNVLCLTLGDLSTVRRMGLRPGEPDVTGRQQSAEGRGGSRQARLGRHPTAERRGHREAEPHHRELKARTVPREGPEGGERSLRVEPREGIR